MSCNGKKRNDALDRFDVKLEKDLVMKILLANLSKMVGHSGGAQKVTCRFADEMKRRGHEVSIVYSDGREGDFFYPLDAGIPVYDLRRYRGKALSFPLGLRLKREWLRLFDKQKARRVNDDFEAAFCASNLQDVLEMTRPDVIVSFQSLASKLLLCNLGTTIPVVTMSHGDTADYFQNVPKEELPGLEKSAVCQVLVPSYERPLREHFPHLKTVVIGNAIPQYEGKADLAAEKETYKIIFTGRLAKGHKRPHLLIEAFATLAKDFPSWTVELWGDVDGKLYYKELQMLIRKHHLEKQVFLKGVTDDVASVLQEGDIFAFPSAYEGFGMSLAEGMSMGLPAIGYRNCGGVNELIHDGIDGYLCEDGVEDFREKLRTLMADRALRMRMGQAARASMAAYAPEKIWDAWETLLEETAPKREASV